MRFKAYKILQSEPYMRIQVGDSEDLYAMLDSSPKLEENEDEYAFMYLKKYNEYVLGTLVQSYTKILTKFVDEDNSKKEEELKDSKINDKTLFYINCETSILFIQSKNYPEYLTAGIMRQRMEKTFSKCFGKEVKIVPTEVFYSLEEVEKIFSESYVKRIAFKNLCGLELPEGIELHNPRKDLDDALIESYNVYSKDKLDSMELKAKKGEQLGKNPFAKIGFALAKSHSNVEVFKDMEIKDNNGNFTIKAKGNDSKIINISKKQQEHTHQAYDAILRDNVKDYKKE